MKGDLLAFPRKFVVLLNSLNNVDFFLCGGISQFPVECSDKLVSPVSAISVVVRFRDQAINQ
jgi:hypothetical protein